MRKLLVILLAVASLAAAGAAADRARPAAAATKTVTISKSGDDPRVVSITAGDEVAFSNSDTVSHTVAFKPTTGMKCSQALPLVLPAGKTAGCTFSSAGTFNFSDPANQSQAFRGKVIVAGPLVSSFTVTPKTILFGNMVTLAGTLTSQRSGQTLKVVAQECTATTPTTLANITTTSGGVFTYQAQPLSRTTYTVQGKNGSTTALTVRVVPRLRLAKTGRHRYRVLVSAGHSFAGKHVSFQRYLPGLRHWRGVKSVRLKANSSGIAPTVVSSAAFRSSIKAHQRVRVVITPAAASTCYVTARSNNIRS